MRVRLDPLCYRVMSEYVSLRPMGVPSQDPNSIVAQSAAEILQTFATLRGAALIYHEISKRMLPAQAHVLYKALQPHGLRTPYWGTLSGRYATVGGGASQNSIFWGSGQSGTAADNVLSVSVVTSKGEVMRPARQASNMPRLLCGTLARI